MYTILTGKTDERAGNLIEFVCFPAIIKNSPVNNQRNPTQLLPVSLRPCCMFGPWSPSKQGLALDGEQSWGQEGESWTRPLGRPRRTWLNLVQEDANAIPLSSLWRTWDFQGSWGGATVRQDYAKMMMMMIRWCFSVYCVIWVCMSDCPWLRMWTWVLHNRIKWWLLTMTMT